MFCRERVGASEVGSTYTATHTSENIARRNSGKWVNNLQIIKLEETGGGEHTRKSNTPGCLEVVLVPQTMKEQRYAEYLGSNMWRRRFAASARDAPAEK